MRCFSGPISPLRCIVVGTVLSLWTACDVYIAGTVFFDHDGDGILSDGDEPLREGYVFRDTDGFTAIDDDGGYVFDIDKQPEFVWVRGTDTSTPGPFWVAINSSESEGIDIPVRANNSAGPFRFVIASDTHVGLVPHEDQTFGLRQATNLDPPPHFIAVTGDIVSGPSVEAFDIVKQATAAIDVPYVPIPGGHDWYDEGALYRHYFGPPNYSFDAGGMHFVVLEDVARVARRESFLKRDLSLITDERDVVVLMHRPPEDSLLSVFSALGVDYLMTGHLHANRVLSHDGMIEYNTQPLVTGGIDTSPAGYRVFSRNDDGSLHNEGRAVVNEPIIALLSPARDRVAPTCAVRVLAAIEPGASVTEVRATIDDMPSVSLTFVGGWNYQSEELQVCDEGMHQIALIVSASDGSDYAIQEMFEVGPSAPTTTVGDWPMLQGGPEHTGFSPHSLSFPLVPAWVGSVGGIIPGGSTVVADGRVFVPVSDFGEGVRGGVVALDGATGAMLWEARVGYSVRNAPAVADGVVVFISNDGTVHAVAADTGEMRWSHELAAGRPAVTRNAYSAPTIANGVVFAGVRHELAALDVVTGEVRWRLEPLTSPSDLPSFSSPTIASDVLLMSYDRGLDGLFGYDTHTGAMLWNTRDGVSVHMHGSATIVDDIAYVINATTRVTALNITSGAIMWTRQFEPDANAWDFLATSTPAYADGTLFVGTQRGTLYALDVVTGMQQWSVRGQPSLIRTNHRDGEPAAFPASPVVTPGLVWMASPDGVLRALDADSGDEWWSYDLGVPVIANPVPAGAALIVASYDGTVRAFESVP